MMQRPVEILVVEDSPADARLAKEALLRGPVPKRISIVEDGVQALDFLKLRGPFARSPRPDIVLLDLNLPKRDGLEVLAEIKSDPALRSITVIVLTTSSYSRDITRAYELMANCYVVKPLDLDQFYGLMRGIEEFWMNMASLPTGSRNPLGPSNAQAESTAPEEPKKGSASAHSHSGVRSPLMRRTPLKTPSYQATRRASAGKR